MKTAFIIAGFLLSYVLIAAIESLSPIHQRIDQHAQAVCHTDTECAEFARANGLEVE